MVTWKESPHYLLLTVRYCNCFFPYFRRCGFLRIRPNRCWPSRQTMMTQLETRQGFPYNFFHQLSQLNVDGSKFKLLVYLTQKWLLFRAIIHFGSFHDRKVVFAVLCMRISFNADPAFYLSADPDPRSQTNADPNSSPTLKSQKVEFLHNIIYTVLKVPCRS